MMKALVFAALVGTAMAACQNGCSGNGKCGANDKCTCYQNWQGADCSQRTCPFELAWVDTANANNNAHYYAECANKGVCDRKTGECKCFDGYEGKGCRRSTCPDKCSGHGTCEYIEELAQDYRDKRVAGVSGRVYQGWDQYKIQGCKCDAGYEGPNCADRTCMRGDDPLTTVKSKFTHQFLALFKGAWMEVKGTTHDRSADAKKFSVCSSTTTCEGITFNTDASTKSTLATSGGSTQWLTTATALATYNIPTVGTLVRTFFHSEEEAYIISAVDEDKKKITTIQPYGFYGEVSGNTASWGYVGDSNPAAAPTPAGTDMTCIDRSSSSCSETTYTSGVRTGLCATCSGVFMVSQGANTGAAPAAPTADDKFGLEWYDSYGGTWRTPAIKVGANAAGTATNIQAAIRAMPNHKFTAATAAAQTTDWVLAADSMYGITTAGQGLRVGTAIANAHQIMITFPDEVGTTGKQHLFKVITHQQEVCADVNDAAQPVGSVLSQTTCTTAGKKVREAFMPSDVFTTKTAQSTDIYEANGLSLMSWTHRAYPNGIHDQTDSTLSEDSVCSNRGMCDTSSGECECFDGFRGLACQEQEALV